MGRKDTEQIADIMWSAGDLDAPWNVPQMIRDIRSETWLKAPRTVLDEGVAHLLVLRDGYVRGAMRSHAAALVVDALHALAREWGLTVTTGAAEHAWFV